VEIIPLQRDDPLLANYLLSLEDKGFWAFPSGITPCHFCQSRDAAASDLLLVSSSDGVRPRPCC
jgi:hypothetical protein